MARITFNGEPGEVFTNETAKVLYQYVAELGSACGVCLQYHHAVGPWWPIPMHRKCRCNQTLIKPGATAEPYVDFRDILAGWTPARQREAVGISSYRLVESGVVRWEDVVTRSRVRTLREVVSREKLTVPRMTAAGVREDIALRAWETVNTPDAVLAKAHRKALVGNLKAAGLSDSAIRSGFAREAAARVVVGPVGGGGTPLTFSPLPVAPLVDILGLDKAKVEAALKGSDDWSLSPKGAAVDAGGFDFAASVAEPPKVPKPAEAAPPPKIEHVDGWKPAPAEGFRALEDMLDADNWIKAHYEGIRGKMTPEQAAAVKRYTGDSYHHINAYLRGQTKTPPSTAADIPEIDAALEARPLPESMVLYRGVRQRASFLKGAGVRKVADIVPGMDLVDRGYTSTALSPDKAFSGEVMLEIRAKAGLPGVAVGEASIHPGEREYLLGRTVDVFRVIEVEPKTKKIVVEAMRSIDMLKDVKP